MLVKDNLASRDFTVWFPTGYRDDSGERYPVLYIWDGQEVFTPNKGAWGWGLESILDRLVGALKLRPFLAVGIWHGERRVQEYSPKRAFDLYLKPRKLSAVKRSGFYPESEGALLFTVMHLKPFIDRTYRTLPDRENTFVLGSSMGGVMSAYAVCEYPDVFGGAACISSHWPIGGGVMIPYLNDHLPEPESHRFYFDHGTEHVERQYLGFQKKVDAILRTAGYVEHRNWVTRIFAGYGHSHADWRSRIDAPLDFLLGRH